MAMLNNQRVTHLAPWFFGFGSVNEFRWKWAPRSQRIWVPSIRGMGNLDKAKRLHIFNISWCKQKRQSSNQPIFLAGDLKKNSSPLYLPYLPSGVNVYITNWKITMANSWVVINSMAIWKSSQTGDHKLPEAKSHLKYSKITRFLLDQNPMKNHGKPPWKTTRGYMLPEGILQSGSLSPGLPGFWGTPDISSSNARQAPTVSPV